MSDWVHLEHFAFACRVGLYPGEQDREQPIEVSVHLGLDLERAAAGDLAQSIDYARVMAQVEHIGRNGNWRMLESFALTLARWFLLAPGQGEGRAQVNEVRIEIRKPEACGGRAVPKIEVARHRERLGLVAHELAQGVSLESIATVDGISVYRIGLRPRVSFRPSFPVGTRIAWLSIAGVAKAGGVELERDATHVGEANDLFPVVETTSESLTALMLCDHQFAGACAIFEGDSMSQTTTIEIYKEAMKFSAGHFTVFSATERERLHGHNYTVYAALTGEKKANGLMFDYGIYKHYLIDLCREFNEIFLLPTRSPYLRIEDQGERVIAHFGAEQIPFLKKDVMLLPVSNVSVEELSQLLLDRVVAFREERGDMDISCIVIKVFTGPGQGASASWKSQTDQG
jgi:6-pyruvoyltetrahydropterin/6-carboxytetrahydropterin synthase